MGCSMETMQRVRAMMKSETRLKTLIKVLALIALGIALGYFWHFQAVAYSVCMSAVHPAGWVEDNEHILAARDEMGPRYNYKIVDQILYVDRGDGQWLRLRY